MNPVYIIDNSNFCYKFKAIHKYAKTTVNNVIVDTSVLVGYIKAIKTSPFKDIIIVLDGIPHQFLNILPSYKGQRNHLPNDNNLEVPHLEVIKFLTCIGSIYNKNVKVVCAPLQEADQVVSSITHMVTNHLPLRSSFVSAMNTKPLESDKILKYLNVPELVQSKLDVSNYNSVVIGTTDADMAQLQRFSGVYIDTSTSGKAVTSTRTADSVSGCTPMSIPAYKAIYGDSSDNIPSLTISSYKKDDVCKMLSEHIKSMEDFDQLIKGIHSHECSLPAIFTPLINEIISTNQVQAFDRNLAITKLDFYSVPIVLQFTDYNISDTISKYNLHM